MRIALFGRNLSAENKPYMRQLLEDLWRHGAQVSVYGPFMEWVADSVPECMTVAVFSRHEELKGRADLLLSIGGDGTILDAVPLIRDADIPVLGINMGRLGFLSSVAKDEISQTVDNLFQGRYATESRTLLELVAPQGVFHDAFNYALNEINIIRNPEHSLLAIKVFVNDVFLNTYWGDGILMATPTGSTAYSLSAGGPILTPDARNFVITPIAAHNLTVRPIVIPDDSVVRIHVEGREKQFVFSMDSRVCALDTSVELVVRKADFCIRTVRMTDTDFFSTIRNKLMWGKDNRN
ncbi:MAG: NAD kinase [Bacteroidales bacterium]|nr:NAD kinase [Bacteroidales bacterium]